MVSVFPLTVRSTMIIVSEISLTIPVKVTFVSFTGLMETALGGSFFTGTEDGLSVAKIEVDRIRTAPAINTISRFMRSNLPIPFQCTGSPDNFFT
jgi:hypothetical protein